MYSLASYFVYDLFGGNRKFVSGAGTGGTKLILPGDKVTAEARDYRPPQSKSFDPKNTA